MTESDSSPGYTTASVDPYHHTDAPASRSMHVLPVDRAVEWIRAWTKLDWPITWETAYATRDKHCRPLCKLFAHTPRR
ncbi:hypothetical protein [Actinomyces procaprae]|uniref:hypothetical protein n=1 Tax=Actinomyces procaprae TaxID=2560010 RepID=UPI00109DB09B|nr:hypothetical protein [Actinomyces procaprae]